MEPIYQFIYETDFSLVWDILIFGLGVEAGKIYAVLYARWKFNQILKSGALHEILEKKK